MSAESPDACVFKENKGAGVANSHRSSPRTTNCVFVKNEAGISNYARSSPLIVNCTFSGNTSASRGGAIRNSYGSSPVVRNSILWGNGPPEVLNDGKSACRVYQSDVKGGHEGEGNLDADPLFAAPEKGDFRLRKGSPCIDAGTEMDGPKRDLVGNARPAGAAHDMGAYEFGAKPAPAEAPGKERKELPPFF